MKRQKYVTKAEQLRQAIAKAEFIERSKRETGDKMARRREDDALIEAFLAKGGSVHTCKARTHCVRKEQVFSVQILRGKRYEYVAARIPAIASPVIPVKGGAVQYCTPRSRG